MVEARIYEIITQYREQIAELEWRIKRLSISLSEITTEGDIVSLADFDL
jgi:hypothetical protein